MSQDRHILCAEFVGSPLASPKKPQEVLRSAHSIVKSQSGAMMPCEIRILGQEKSGTMPMADEATLSRGGKATSTGADRWRNATVIRSESELIHTLVAQILAGRVVVTVVDAFDIDRSEISASIGKEIQSSGGRLVRVAGKQASPQRVQELIARAVGVPMNPIGPGAPLLPSQILERLTKSDRAGQIVLFIDDADWLPAEVFCYLSLMITLFDFSRTKLHLILLGSSFTCDAWDHATCTGPRTAAGSHSVIYRTPHDAPAEDVATQQGDSERPGPVVHQTEPPGPPAPDGSAWAWSYLLAVPPLVNGRPEGHWRQVVQQSIMYAVSSAMVAACLLTPSTMTDRNGGANHLVRAIAAVTDPAPTQMWLRRWNKDQTAALPSSAPSTLVRRPPPHDLDQALPAPGHPEQADVEQQNPKSGAVEQGTKGLGQPDPGATASLARIGGDATSIASALRLLHPHSSLGLVLLAEADDALPVLYSEVYRGLRPPPYAEVVAANRGRIGAGAIVVFPAPPEGWAPQ